MAVSDEAMLLGDIGATNARFALAVDGRLGPIKWIEVARYPSVTDAIDVFLQGQFRVKVAKARLAVAGPVSDERCTFTNCAWTVDGSEMRNRFEFNNVQIINDFEATALSLPHLMEQDLHSLGGGRAVSGAPMVVLGPGSGLGVAGLVGMVPAGSLLQAKAAMRRCQPPRFAKMPFSIICASVSATFQRNGCSQGRALKICIMLSPRSMGSSAATQRSSRSPMPR